MIRGYREAFNAAYTDARYRAFVNELARRCGVPIEFRLSETPGFFPRDLIRDLARAALAMVTDLLADPAYHRASKDIVPDRFRLPRSEAMPTFVQVDFGLVRAGDRIEGRLVELQAFPSLYGFQLLLAETSRDVWGLDGVSPFPADLSREAYVRLVGGAIVGNHDPAEVVLMEIDPVHQKTRPDFAATERLWGVRAVDVREVTREGRRLFYDRDGVRTPIARVYNRVIPDDLQQQSIALPFDYRDDLDVEWTGSPDWYFRVSKFSIPFLRHPWVPRTFFLHEIERLPDDRDQWLLKPLFSYAGGGIIFAPTDEQIGAIPASERHLYVLQERVAFTPVIETPHGPTQAELRLMLVRDAGAYGLVLPLVRMGRGRMMGVDHNKGLAWVGSAAAMLVG
jgi:hypothetical protein